MVKMMEVEISDGDGDTLKEAARKVKVSNKILDCKLQVDKDFFSVNPHTRSLSLILRRGTRAWP